MHHFSVCSVFILKFQLIMSVILLKISHDKECEDGGKVVIGGQNMEMRHVSS